MANYWQAKYIQNDTLTNGEDWNTSWRGSIGHKHEAHETSRIAPISMGSHLKVTLNVPSPVPSSLLPLLC